MDIKSIIGIIVVAALVIGFIIWLVWQLKKNGLKGFTINMIVKAEDMFNKGDNEQKISFVINKIISVIPLPFSLFITEKMVRNFVQKVFDDVKTALDFKPKEG